MKKRIISGVIMAILLVIIYVCPPIVFDIAVGILAAGAYYELTKVRKDLTIPNIMKYIGFIFLMLIMYMNIDTISYSFGIDYTSLTIGFIIMFIPTLFMPKKYNTKEAFYLASTSLFLGVTFNLLVQTFNLNKVILVWLILIACSTDIFALFGGMLIGKHKLTPISPKKTIEGSITGLIVAVIVGTFFYLIFINKEVSIPVIMLVTAVLSCAGQMGDLFFSLIKRENEVKDYSHLIPGHGGILDRIDSTVFILLFYIVLSRFL
jgi:phosphatidate cytidylyltransferase